MPSNASGEKIESRYGLIPQRNTTNWQTIILPTNVLRIRVADLLGIGVEDNIPYKNEIYAVRSNQPMLRVTGVNISEHTIRFISFVDVYVGAAFTYTVIRYSMRIFFFSFIFHFCIVFLFRMIDVNGFINLYSIKI